MSTESDFIAFRQAAAILRFSWPEEATSKQLRRLLKVFAEQAGKCVQNASSSDLRAFRLSVVAELLNRPIRSFSAITTGEAMLIINERDLDSLVRYVWKRRQGG
jgi:hypothetical protein